MFGCVLLTLGAGRRHGAITSAGHPDGVSIP